MEDILYRNLFLYNAGGIDWVTILALSLFAVVYFLAPVLGYNPSRRGLIAAAMFALLGKMGLTLFRSAMAFLQIMDHSSSRPMSSGKSEMMVTLYSGLSVLETGALTVAALLFVVGLLTLSWRTEARRHADGRGD